MKYITNSILIILSALVSSCTLNDMRVVYLKKDAAQEISTLALSNLGPDRRITSIKEVFVINVGPKSLNPPGNILMIELITSTSAAETVCKRVIDNFRGSPLVAEYTELVVSAGDGTEHQMELDVVVVEQSGTQSRIRGPRYYSETTFCAFRISKEDLLQRKEPTQTFKNWKELKKLR